MKCLVLLLFAASTLSLSAVTDEFCSSVSKKRSADDSSVSVCHAHSLIATKYLFMWVLFSHHSTYGVCIDEEIVKWYSLCVSSHSVGRRCGNSGHRNGMWQDSLSNSIPSRSVDYLFLVDQTYLMENVHTEIIFKAIQSLVEQTQNEDVFYSVEAQFGFITYSKAREKVEYGYAKDFSSEYPYDLRSILSSPSPSMKDGKPHPPLPSDYEAVEGSLKVITRSLKLVNKENKFYQRVHLYNNKSLHLWHRPYSDLHIVSLLDLGRNHSSNEDRESEVETIRNSIGQNIVKLSQRVDALNAYPLSLHFVFSDSNTAALSLLGDPSLSVRYPDCSHFKKAATLKALISHSQGDSLQALLLSKGVEMQVHSLKDLESSRCILNFSPALSSTLGLKPFFANRCWSNLGVSGSDGFYCSTLHGRTKKEVQNNRGPEEVPSEDKVPLPGKFGSSHVDIAKSFNTDKTRYRVPHRKLFTHKDDGNFAPVIEGELQTLSWKQDQPFIAKIIEGGEPMRLRGTVVETWPALRKWNMSYLSQHMDTDVLNSVKCTDEYLTFDPDHTTPLKLDISLTYTLANLSTNNFFKCIQSSSDCNDKYKGHYYFGNVPDTLKKDILPNKFLYSTKRDIEASKQFMWISSAGMITHTHFDQDYNIFVQLVGRKKFTLWSPSQHELMYTFPRVHPMWHKSRVNYRSVDLLKFPSFSQARATQVELGPGDMLYVPPYTWHYVETLSPSVSLSTWSHDYSLYDHMNAIYKHDHKFDLLQNQKGQMFVLRLYLDMLVHDLYGFNETTQFFARLINNRFSGLEYIFPASENDPEICDSSVSGKIPTCIHVHGYAKLDMSLVGFHFQALEPTVRDILFNDYVEEITAQVVGVRKMLAFFRYCFLGQEYYVTDIEDEEHELWEHRNSEPSEI